MVGTERRAWVALEIIGILVLLLGVSRYIGVPDNIPNIGETASMIIIAAGILLIVEASMFIYLEGVRLNREIEAFEKSKEDAENAAAAATESIEVPETTESEATDPPNDLDEAYLLDFAANPTLAALYLDERIVPADVGEEEDVGRIGPGEPIGRLGPGTQTENDQNGEPPGEEIERLGPATKKAAPKEETGHPEPADSNEEEWIVEPSNDEFY